MKPPWTNRILVLSLLLAWGCSATPTPSDATGADGGAVECGDGICSPSAESCQSCAQDCGGCSNAVGFCGDATCNASTETCLTCAQDCGTCSISAVCGDATCAAGAEACWQCPEDCGACPVVCGDGTCDPDQETCGACPQDCGACSGGCGDTACDAELESCFDCPEDCGQCPAEGTCGDGTCVAEEGEDCSSCAADCGACSLCGNGVCNDGRQNETCSTCPADCGACKPCGDGVCEKGVESCSSCPSDCGRCDPCGDGVCKGSETCNSCRADCGACARNGCVQGKFSLYYGNLHSHTGYSDGQDIPETAFTHARNAGLDFLWVTDHKGPTSLTEWQKCKEQAEKKNAPGAFLAGCGYEIDVLDAGGNKLGHFNALFSNARMVTPVGLADLFQKLANDEAALGQFNHPPWPGRFADYKFFPAGKPGMRLMEFSGGGTWAEKTDAYFTALRNGWRISPSMNEDNHSRTWGDTRRATGVWATELTRGALREAVEGNRTFATPDETASITFKADDVCWMGSVLRGGGEVSFTVVARDRQDADKFRRIELRGTGGGVLESRPCNGSNPCTARFKRDPRSAMFWVAMAVQEDGDTLVSAPIWFEP